jgi:predicted metal-dependent hydrolase
VKTMWTGLKTILSRPAAEPSAAQDHSLSLDDGRAVTVRVVRLAQARRMTLRLDARGPVVRLTLPRSASLRSGLDWTATKRDWIARQLDALPDVEPIRPGMVIPLGDERLALDWAQGHSRRVVRDGNTLRVGGPEAMLAGRVLRWLKAEALDRLTQETHIVAAKAGVNVTAVGVGDPVSRWGSCSSSGAIRYSWRLILAPDAVLRATVAHEVAHRVHMDHSPRFHALVRELYGRDPKAERAWLRSHGRGLHGFGRVS